MHRTIQTRVRSDEQIHPIRSTILICIAIVLLAASAGPVSADTVPRISVVSPSGGPSAGGTVVTLTGSGFYGATNVQFDGIPGTNLIVSGDNSLTIVTPPHSPGTVAISVLGAAGGNSTWDSSAIYQYEEVPFPRVSGLSPASGPVTGSTVVTITGSGFNGAESVRFGKIYAWDMKVIDDNHITARSPSSSPGSVSITVKNTAGTGSPSGESAMFLYEFPFPVLTAISPSSGSTAGGTRVTVSGSGLSGATSVRFGGIPGTGLTVIDNTELTVISPPNPAGSVGLSVINPDHTGNSAGAATVFRYDVPIPRLTRISPLSGAAEGGTVVTLTGSGFSGTKEVRFGEKTGTGLTVTDDSHITITAPAHSPGSVPISITNAIGEGGTLEPSTMFRYEYSSATTPAVTATTTPGQDQPGGGNSSPAVPVPATSPAPVTVPATTATLHTPGFGAVLGFTALGAVLCMRKGLRR